MWDAIIVIVSAATTHIALDHSPKAKELRERSVKWTERKLRGN